MLDEKNTIFMDRKRNFLVSVLCFSYCIIISMINFLIYSMLNDTGYRSVANNKLFYSSIYILPLLSLLLGIISYTRKDRFILHICFFLILILINIAVYLYIIFSLNDPIHDYWIDWNQKDVKD